MFLYIFYVFNSHILFHGMVLYQNTKNLYKGSKKHGVGRPETGDKPPLKVATVDLTNLKGLS